MWFLRPLSTGLLLCTTVVLAVILTGEKPNFPQWMTIVGWPFTLGILIETFVARNK